MKYFIPIFIAFLFISSSNLYSQTSENIRLEANTDYVFVPDNSPYALAQKELIALRKSGNEHEYLAKLQQNMNQFPDKFKKSQPVSSNVLRSISPDPNKKNIPAMETDWANGEILISSRNISSPTSGNPTPNNRLIRMTADSSGALFVAFIDAGRDTLFFYRSTDQGAHWTQIVRIAALLGFRYQGFDIDVTDANGGTGSIIGMVMSIVPVGSLYNGSVYYASMFSDGNVFNSSLVEASVGGRGRISPCITTDGWDRSPVTTNWYVAYQSADTNTGETNAAIAALSPDGGSTWLYDTARSTFNDYELDINYDFGADSIYVLLTNNLTTTNANLRIRWLALSNWGTNITWKQFNPATTAAPEFDGQFAVNREDNSMVVIYTIQTGGINNVNYSYTLTGFTPWVTGVPIVSQANNVERASIYSLPQQTGSYSAAFISRGSAFDTVLYYNTINIGTVFSGRQVVNQNNASSTLKPVIAAGFYPSAFAAVAFAGSGNSGIYADGSALLTEILPVGNFVPEAYKLEQNYPNPFNPGTTISFSIPKNKFVTLKIYDVLGKEAANLVNQELTTGQYNVSFNAGNLSSGIYFYTLRAEDYTETKSMLLLK